MSYPQGLTCTGCKSSEARCAWLNGCCARCSHFRHLDARGNDRPDARLRDTPCGTELGYQAHRYRRVAACEPCKAAHSRHNLAQKAAS